MPVRFGSPAPYPSPGHCMAEKEQSFSYVYEEVPNRPVLPVQGAYGGPSPDGFSIVANVYAEYGTVPAREDVEVDQEGRTVPNKQTYIKRADATRLVTATLVLTPEAAIRVGQWLFTHGNAAMLHRKANEPKEVSGTKEASEATKDTEDS